MEAQLHEALCHVQGTEADFVMERFRRDDAFVHHGPVKSDVVRAAHTLVEPVRVEHCDLGRPFQAVAPVQAQVHPGAKHTNGVSMPGVHSADRAFRRGELVARPVTGRSRTGEERGQSGAHGHGACTRASPAMGRRERLVHVQVHDVETHVPRPHDPEDRVQVCTVVVEQAADVVHRLGDLDNVLLEQAEGTGFVSIIPATSSSNSPRNASRSTPPRALVPTVTTS